MWMVFKVKPINIIHKRSWIYRIRAKMHKLHSIQPCDLKTAICSSNLLPFINHLY